MPWAVLAVSWGLGSWYGYRAVPMGAAPEWLRRRFSAWMGLATTNLGDGAHASFLG